MVNCSLGSLPLISPDALMSAGTQINVKPTGLAALMGSRDSPIGTRLSDDWRSTVVVMARAAVSSVMSMVCAVGVMMKTKCVVATVVCSITIS
ncbi:hypothetical protein ASD03_32360 [Ensifer sp. Root127]|nr:hypothetical protein ASD03_32360 [Ensifer sp. Root127]